MKGRESLVGVEKEQEQPIVIMVYFYDDDCPACEEFWSTWKLFKEMHKNEATFIEVNASDKGRRLFKRLKIRYVPTVAVFINNVEYDRLEGAGGLEDLESMLSSARRDYIRGYAY